MTAVNLAELVETVALAPEDETLYVNRLTGERYAIAAEEEAIMGEVHDDMFPDVEVEIIDEIRSVLASADWIELPSAVNVSEVLPKFTGAIADEATRARFEQILSMQSVPTLSQTIVDFFYDMELEAQWSAFEREKLREAIAARLSQHQISYC